MQIACKISTLVSEVVVEIFCFLDHSLQHLNAKVWPLMILISSWPTFIMKSRILLTSFSGDIHTVSVMYKDQLSIHKNRFIITFVKLSFVPEALRLFVLFAMTLAIV